MAKVQALRKEQQAPAFSLDDVLNSATSAKEKSTKSKTPTVEVSKDVKEQVTRELLSRKNQACIWHRQCGASITPNGSRSNASGNTSRPDNSRSISDRKVKFIWLILSEKKRKELRDITEIERDINFERHSLADVMTSSKK